MNTIYTGTEPYRDEDGNIIFYELVNIRPPTFTLEMVEKEVKKFFEGRPPFIKNHRWTGEDGQKYSSWEFNTGKSTIHAGDGGAEMIFKEFQKQGFTLPNFNKENEQTNT